MTAILERLRRGMDKQLKIPANQEKRSGSALGGETEDQSGLGSSDLVISAGSTSAAPLIRFYG